MGGTTGRIGADDAGISWLKVRVTFSFCARTVAVKILLPAAAFARARRPGAPNKLLGWWLCRCVAGRLCRRVHLQFRHQQKIQDAEIFLVAINDHCPTRRRAGQELRMSDLKRPPVRHMNREWPKRLCVVSIIQMLNRHAAILPQIAPFCRGRR